MFMIIMNMNGIIIMIVVRLVSIIVISILAILIIILNLVTISIIVGIAIVVIIVIMFIVLIIFLILLILSHPGLRGAAVAADEPGVALPVAPGQAAQDVVRRPIKRRSPPVHAVGREEVETRIRYIKLARLRK